MEFFAFNSTETGKVFDWLQAADKASSEEASLKFWPRCNGVIDRLINSAIECVEQEGNDLSLFDDTVALRSVLTRKVEALVARESQLFPMSDALSDAGSGRNGEPLEELYSFDDWPAEGDVGSMLLYSAIGRVDFSLIAEALLKLRGKWPAETCRPMVL